MLLLNVSTLWRFVLLLEVSTPKRPEMHLWPVYTTGQACASSGGVGTVVLLEVSSPQRPDLHLDMSTLHRLVLLWEVSSPQRHELHLDISILHA